MLFVLVDTLLKKSSHYRYAGKLIHVYVFFLGVQPKRNYGGDFKTWKELDAINKSTMDHLPKPSGSWQEGYRAKDSKANIAFGVSVVLFVLTLVEVRN